MVLVILLSSLCSKRVWTAILGTFCIPLPSSEKGSGNVEATHAFMRERRRKLAHYIHNWTVSLAKAHSHKIVCMLWGWKKNKCSYKQLMLLEEKLLVEKTAWGMQRVWKAWNKKKSRTLIGREAFEALLESVVDCRQGKSSIWDCSIYIRLFILKQTKYWRLTYSKVHKMNIALLAYLQASK